MALTSFFVCCGLLAVILDPARAECPDHHDIDVKWNRTHYMGAYRYDSSSSSNPLQSCKGTAKKRYEGYEATTKNGTQFVEHAWVVRPGCVVYEFSDYNYEGTQTRFEAGVHPQVPKGSKSYKVRCDIAHFKCTPIDKFEAVITCNATAAVEDTECNYMTTVGTTFSKSVSDSMSISASLEQDIKASFWNLFSSLLRTSSRTGYNWNSVPEAAKGKKKSVQVDAIAPAGVIYKVEQVIGKCGENEVKTEFFRFSNNKKAPDNDL